MKNARPFVMLLSLLFFHSLSFAQGTSVYKTVNINGVEWATDNLRATKFNNGDIIPMAKDSADWVKAANEKKPMCGIVKNNNRVEYVYNFYVLMDRRGVLPPGFAFPSDADYQALQTSFQKNPSLIPKLRMTSVGSYSYNRYRKRLSFDPSTTIFWYKDESSVDFEKEYNMGTCYGVFDQESCKEKFPANCDGTFSGFETFYELGGADAGNGLCVRLKKKK
jgi:uncharacterized protein (TIGR02145 family)